MFARVRKTPIQPRLSIFISEEAADFLDCITRRRRISYTEAVRRALSLYKLFEDQQAAGGRVHFENSGLRTEVLAVSEYDCRPA